MNIDIFKSTVSAHGGFTRASNFKIFLPIPKFISELNIKQLNETDLNTLCIKATIPDRQLSSIDYSAWGKKYKTPTSLVENSFKLTFVHTNDNVVRDFFTTWIESIYNTDSNRLMYRDDFSTDISIFQLALDQKSLVSANQYIQAWPVNIGSVELQEQNTDIQTIEIEFEYFKKKRIALSTQRVDTIVSSIINDRFFKENNIGLGQGGDSLIP